MAIIKCKECGKDVSDRATVCPHCGYVFASEEEKAKKAAMGTAARICLACVILIVAIIGAMGLTVGFSIIKLLLSGQ